MLRVCRFAMPRAFACAALTLMTAARVGAQGVKVEEKVAYQGAPNNIRLSNGQVELILSTDFGPRILRFAPVGSGEDANLFASMPGPTSKTDLGEWYIRGGHRLWHAPEAMPRTYEPDNDPITARRDGDTLRLIQATEPVNKIQKEIWVRLDPNRPKVTVTHKLTNRGLFPVEMAAWALTVMNKGGTGIFPQEPFKAHGEELLPARPLVLWTYTDMSDPRWMWGKTLFTLRQDPNRKEAQKVGILNKQGWAAYARNGLLFLKRFPYVAGKTYPDYNVNCETFTNGDMLEVETLGPLETVAPGQTITHVETWWLFRNVNPGATEAGIIAAMQPLLRESAP